MDYVQRLKFPKNRSLIVTLVATMGLLTPEVSAPIDGSHNPHRLYRDRLVRLQGLLRSLTSHVFVWSRLFMPPSRSGPF
jgi:hypothetical protein